MNLSELFFFKVFECVQDSNNNNKLNKSSHNEKNCYFYHTSLNLEKDRRREPISFIAFFQQLKTNLEEEGIPITLDTIFEFKNKENNFSLNYYTNKPNFQNYNSYIYSQFDCCKNDTEYFYHIKNYKNKKFKYFEINKKCKKKFCDKYHNNEKNDNEDNGINFMRNIIDSWIEKNEIKLIEIIEVFNKILSYDNKLLKYKLNEIKKDFEPFLKFYNDYKNANQGLKNNNLLNINKYKLKDENKARRIMQEINRELNPHNIKNKIYKNSNLFEALNLPINNITYIAPSDILKSGRLIKYIYAFLNSCDGTIIYGGKLLDNNYIVKGISIKQKDREKFKKWFNAEFLKLLVEFEECLKYKFYDIANNNNEECVLVINVKQIKLTKFFMPSSRSFYIINEDILKKINKQNNKNIDEKDFIELDTKQYIEFLTKRFSEYYTKKFGISNIK